MQQEQDITPLLKSFVSDNPTYDFPIKTIQYEITNMFITQNEFDYFFMMAFRKLKREFNQTIANVFITTCDLYLDLKNVDMHIIPAEEYYDKIEGLYDVLSNLKITRIEKSSPDGIMLTAMQ
jgi:hypothetical protein